MGRATKGRKRTELLHDVKEGKRLRTYEIFNLRQIKIASENAYQKHAGNSRR